MNWSLGTYMTNAEVEKAFGVTDLPKPWSVAPNQPFTGSFYYTWGLLPLGLLFIVAIFMIPFTGLSSTVLNQEITLPPMANPATPQVAFSKPVRDQGQPQRKDNGIGAGQQFVCRSGCRPYQRAKPGGRIGKCSGRILHRYGQRRRLVRRRAIAGRDDVITAGRQIHASGRGNMAELAAQPMPVSVKVEQNVDPRC